jgi:hypothetical protein
MKRFARALVVILALAVIGSVVSLVPQNPTVAAGGAPVSIMSPLPLPVTGSVNATVNGTVATQQSGKWNVGIDGTPNVNVGNFPVLQPVSFSNSGSTPLFVDTDGPARAAVSGSCNANYDANGFAQCLAVNVPLGKILVVDALSVSTIVTSGKSIFDVEVDTTAKDIPGSGVTVEEVLPVRLVGSDGLVDNYAFAGPFTI